MAGFRRNENAVKTFEEKFEGMRNLETEQWHTFGELNGRAIIRTEINDALRNSYLILESYGLSDDEIKEMMTEVMLGFCSKD